MAKWPYKQDNKWFGRYLNAAILLLDILCYYACISQEML